MSIGCVSIKASCSNCKSRWFNSVGNNTSDQNSYWSLDGWDYSLQSYRRHRYPSYWGSLQCCLLDTKCFVSFLYLSPSFCKNPASPWWGQDFELTAFLQPFRTMKKSSEVPLTLRHLPGKSLSSSLPSLTGLTRSYPQFLVSRASFSEAQQLHLKGAQWCAERSFVVTEWKCMIYVV